MNPYDELQTKLNDLYSQIKDGLISYASAANQLHISVYKFKHLLLLHGFELIEKKPGRMAIEPTTEEIERTVQYTDIFKVGYKRCADSLKRRGIQVSQNTIHKIYQKNDLFVQEAHKKKEKHIYRYFAKYKDQQWNTDLHEIWINIDDQVLKAYLIAFLDDATRYVIHAEIMMNKTSLNTSNALQNALKKGVTPFILHSDNGMEFKGSDFQKILNENNIKFTTTTPYTPQQNGKIERWWQTFDTSLISIDNLMTFVEEYNQNWYHHSLKERFGRKTTPAEARNLLSSWVGKDDLKYIYST